MAETLLEKSILLGESHENLRFVVRAQQQTSIASVELHDIHHAAPRQLDEHLGQAFMDLSIGARPGAPTACYPEVSGHQAHRIGEMVFIPAHQRLQSSWQGGRQRSVCVLFNRTADWLERDWTARELDSMLDLRDGAIRAVMLRIAEELMQPGFESSLMIEALCMQLTIHLRRQWRRIGCDVQDDRAALASGQLRSIKERLDCPGPPPSLVELAALCGLSTRHFGRLFRQATGQSFTDFAVERRIERAKTLLADSRVPIKQVAWQCGFQTPAAFSVAFRKGAGVPPSTFREARRH